SMSLPQTQPTTSYFFFQAEDGIRDFHVTGVQTCALPISITLPVGVMVLDRAGDIMLGNPAAGHIWGGTIVSGRERWVKSKGYWHASGQAIDPREWASRHALDEGRTSRDELIDIETFDGLRKTIENYAAPIHDGAGAITGAVVVNEDVTERVRAEDALRKTERLLVDAEKLGQTGGWEQDLISP